MHKPHRIFSFSMLTIALLFATATPAFAIRGAVKVECRGDCSNVTLGNACDAILVGSFPVAVACDDTGKTGGSFFGCGGGGASCSSESYERSMPLSFFCTDGSGTDAIVTCL
jgi:hypothetical protein